MRARAGQGPRGVKGALAQTSGPHPAVQGWYANFLQTFVLPHAAAWSYAITFGELAVGLGLLLGVLTGIAAFFGVFMNLNYLLAGAVSTNPILGFLGLFLILAWRIAGYYGLDRYLLPLLGTPWTGTLIGKDGINPETGKQTNVTLLHVISRHIVYGRTGSAPAETFDLPAERAAVSALLSDSAEYLGAAGIGFEVSQESLLGDPAEELLAFAADHDTDLIILGSRGLNAAQRFLMGSVSTRVATHAQCAVLVVHPKPGTAQETTK